MIIIRFSQVAAGPAGEAAASPQAAVDARLGAANLPWRYSLCTWLAGRWGVQGRRVAEFVFIVRLVVPFLSVCCIFVLPLGAPLAGARRPGSKPGVFLPDWMPSVPVFVQSHNSQNRRVYISSLAWQNRNLNN